MDINEFAKKAISKLNKSITDQVFLTIQNDRDLMSEYLRLVEEKKLDPVNRLIGKAVKESYHLTNDDQRNENPTSTLIKTYQEFQ
jgi:hypothetical protein